MAATITPVVHGGRRTGWAGSLALHLAGAAGAAAAFGATLGLLGGVLGAPWGGGGLALVAVLAVAYAARELLGAPIPVPERRRQVPQWWRTYFSPGPAALLYGLGLGIGFLTYQRTGTLTVVAAAAGAAGDPWTGAALLAPFGIARALALAAVGRARTSEQVRGVVDRLEGIASSRGLPLLNGAALLAVATAAGIEAGGLEGLPSAAAAVLAGVFAWAAGSKVAGPRAWRETVAAYRLGPLEGTVRAAVPATELAVSVLVLAGRPVWAGGAALALLAAFSWASVRARTEDGVPCGCFGGRRTRPLGWVLARNAVLGALAAAALAGGRETSPPWSPPTGAEVLPAILAGAGIAGAAALVLVWRARLRPREPGGSARRPTASEPDRSTIAHTEAR